MIGALGESNERGLICSCWEKCNFILIYEFKYGQTLKMWPSPLSLSFYNTFKVKYFLTFMGILKITFKLLTYVLFVLFRLWLIIYSGGLFTLTYRKQLLFIYSHKFHISSKILNVLCNWSSALTKWLPYKVKLKSLSTVTKTFLGYK